MRFNCKISAKCLAFLNAEHPISYYYTFGQNNYTRRPLAYTKVLKKKSAVFNCQDDIHSFIEAFSYIIPSDITTSLLTLQFVTSYRTQSAPIKYIAHKKSSLLLHETNVCNIAILHNRLQLE
jgi:hypothetical protein